MVATQLPIIRIAGLPDFNEESQNVYAIEDLTNWWNTAPPTSLLVPNGGGPGAVAAGDWEPTEEYLNLSGWVTAAPSEQEAFRRQLLAALPASEEVALVYVGNGWDVDKQIFVRRFDRPVITKEWNRLTFSFPLVAPDPYKYGVATVGGMLGVFTGEQWYRTYALSSGAYVRTYTFGTAWTRSYQQAIASGPFPPSLYAYSAGDVVSQRITFTVTGPLTAGDWWLLNETTGERLAAQIDLVAGQSLVFDSYQKTALLNGADVGYLVYGNWLTLEPGGNTYRLASGTQTDATATVTGLEAYL